LSALRALHNQRRDRIPKLQPGFDVDRQVNAAQTLDEAASRICESK
jgi:hypothetical protein